MKISEGKLNCVHRKICLPNAESMLDQRPRRWITIETTLRYFTYITIHVSLIPFFNAAVSNRSPSAQSFTSERQYLLTKKRILSCGFAEQSCGLWVQQVITKMTFDSPVFVKQNTRVDKGTPCLQERDILRRQFCDWYAVLYIST